MDHEWFVTVNDNSGTPVTNAKVALVQFNPIASQPWPFRAVAATHRHIDVGLYQESPPIAPVEGVWVLIVLVPGKSPVTQLVTFKTKSSSEILTIPTALLSPVAPKLASTIRFVSEAKTIAGVTARRTHFGVTVYPSSEVVLVSGIEFFQRAGGPPGTQFRIFAENYRNGLRKEKVIDEGVVATLFSADDRARQKFVPAAGGGWVAVEALGFGLTAHITPGTNHRPVVGDDVSITDVYKYLDEVGKTEPGRVTNVGFFAHSFPGGPLLFNTMDGSSTAARDPTDFDGRVKDFNSTNVAHWPDMKKAMSTTGAWHVWGCSATPEHLTQAVSAYQHRHEVDSKFFTIRTTVLAHGGGAIVREVEERTTRRHIRFEMDERFRRRPYMAAAAAHLGISVFGAPPGVGSSFDQKRNLMFIDTQEYALAFAYFKSEFGPEFTPTNESFDRGYIDYHKLANRAAPPAPPFSSEYYLLQQFPADTSSKGRAVIFFAKGRVLRVNGGSTQGRSGIEFAVTSKLDLSLQASVGTFMS